MTTTRTFPPEAGIGGSLHIVLEDGNVADSHVRFCLKYARQQGDAPGIRLAATLLNMSKTQRLKLRSLKTFDFYPV